MRRRIVVAIAVLTTTAALWIWSLLYVIGDVIETVCGDTCLECAMSLKVSRRLPEIPKLEADYKGGVGCVCDPGTGASFSVARGGCR